MKKLQLKKYIKKSIKEFQGRNIGLISPHTALTEQHAFGRGITYKGSPCSPSPNHWMIGMTINNREPQIGDLFQNHNGMGNIFEVLTVFPMPPGVEPMDMNCVTCEDYQPYSGPQGPGQLPNGASCPQAPTIMDPCADFITNQPTLVSTCCEWCEINRNTQPTGAGIPPEGCMDWMCDCCKPVGRI